MAPRMPIWLLAVFWLGGDIYGAMLKHDNVAYSVHLAGAALAYLYYRTRWQLGRLIPQRWSLSALKPRPRLRVHDPGAEQDDLGAEVDRILKKISQSGEDSLTRKERRTLQRASEKYKQRRG